MLSFFPQKYHETLGCLGSHSGRDEDKSVMEQNYPERDFHDMYVGEIIRVFQA